MRSFPTDDDALRSEVERLAPEVAKQWTLLACEEALSVWERRAARLKLKYRDSVVGLKHEIAPSLPRRALSFVRGGEGARAALAKEYREPVTALQDDDWSLPEVALFAFYACYNAFESLHATAVIQARHATFLDLEGDRQRFDALWARWWHRCQELRQTVSVKGRLSKPIRCERFLELAAAVYRELEIPVGPGSVEKRSKPPQDIFIESIESTRWTDGTHSAELERIWDQPVAFQSRDRSFEAWMDVPECRAKLSMMGMDDLEDYTLSADADELERVQAGLERAARSL